MFFNDHNTVTIDGRTYVDHRTYIDARGTRYMYHFDSQGGYFVDAEGNRLNIPPKHLVEVDPPNADAQ